MHLKSKWLLLLAIQSNVTMSPLFKKEKEKRECFERIFKMYYNNIVYFAFHYLNDYEAAREVAQDVFMIIWQNMEKLEEISFS